MHNEYFGTVNLITLRLSGVEIVDCIDMRALKFASNHRKTTRAKDEATRKTPTAHKEFLLHAKFAEVPPRDYIREASHEPETDHNVLLIWRDGDTETHLRGVARHQISVIPKDPTVDDALILVCDFCSYVEVARGME